MADMWKQRFFQRMGEGPVADVMQEYSDLGCFNLFLQHINPLGANYFQCLSHQVHCTERVVKASMYGTRVHQFSQAQLTNVPHALEEWMLD